MSSKVRDGGGSRRSRWWVKKSGPVTSGQQRRWRVRGRHDGGGGGISGVAARSETVSESGYEARLDTAAAPSGEVRDSGSGRFFRSEDIFLSLK